MWCFFFHKLSSCFKPNIFYTLKLVLCNKSGYFIGILHTSQILHTVCCAFHILELNRRHCGNEIGKFIKPALISRIPTLLQGINKSRRRRRRSTEEAAKTSTKINAVQCNQSAAMALRLRFVGRRRRRGGRSRTDTSTPHTHTYGFTFGTRWSSNTKHLRLGDLVTTFEKSIKSPLIFICPNHNKEMPDM